MTPFQRRRIILATDLSARCDRAFERAVLLAREWDAPLTIVHALEGGQFGRAPSLRWHGIDREKHDAERQILADLQRASIAAAVVVRRGLASEVIVEVARTMSCDLIVTGIAREVGFARAILGSTLEALARESVAPVLTVSGSARESYVSAVVGTNFSKGSRAAIQATLRLFPQAQVTALHAYRPPGGSLGGVQVDNEAAYQHLLDACIHFVAEAAPAPPRKVRCYAEMGFPETLLKQYARDRNVDLIVVGLEARNPVAALLFGGTSRSLILSSPCDLLLVPADWRSSAGEAGGGSQASKWQATSALQVTREESASFSARDWTPERREDALKVGARH